MIEDLYKKLWEKYLNEDYSKGRYDIFRASQLRKCPRLMYFIKKFPVEPENRLKNIFTIGHIIHREIQEILTEFGYKSEVEVSIKVDNFYIKGHADLYSEEDSEVIEIKTVSYLPNKPYTDHILQANFYSQLLDADKYTILYVKKNNLEIIKFTFEPDDELFNFVVNNCRVVNFCLLEDEIPYKKPYEFCRLCTYRELCERL